MSGSYPRMQADPEGNLFPTGHDGVTAMIEVLARLDFSAEDKPVPVQFEPVAAREELGEAPGEREAMDFRTVVAGQPPDRL